MDNYKGKPATRVQNPPGGGSSLSLSWGDPENHEEAKMTCKIGKQSVERGQFHGPVAAEPPPVYRPRVSYGEAVQAPNPYGHIPQAQPIIPAASYPVDAPHTTVKVRNPPGGQMHHNIFQDVGNYPQFPPAPKQQAPPPAKFQTPQPAGIYPGIHQTPETRIPKGYGNLPPKYDEYRPAEYQPTYQTPTPPPSAVYGSSPGMAGGAAFGVRSATNDHWQDAKQEDKPHTSVKVHAPPGGKSSIFF